MTSNLGAAHRREAVGIAARPEADSERYARAVREAFRPEMLNRIDRIVGFGPLSRQEVARVARLALYGIAERRGLQEAGVALEVSERALETLADGGYSETYGVRALRRHLDAHLVTPVAHELSRLGDGARGLQAWIGAGDEDTPPDLPIKQRLAVTPVGDLRLELFRRPAATSKRSLGGVAKAAELRRSHYALPAARPARSTGRHLTASDP